MDDQSLLEELKTDLGQFLAEWQNEQRDMLKLEELQHGQIMGKRLLKAESTIAYLSTKLEEIAKMLSRESRKDKEENALDAELRALNAHLLTLNGALKHVEARVIGLEKKLTGSAAMSFWGDASTQMSKPYADKERN